MVTDARNTLWTTALTKRLWPDSRAARRVGSGARRAGASGRGCTLIQHVVDQLADVGVLDAELPPAGLARARDQLVLVLLVARVDVDRHQRETDRRPLTELVEQLEQRPAVLAARQADHHPVAVFDHPIIDNR